MDTPKDRTTISDARGRPEKKKKRWENLGNNRRLYTKWRKLQLNKRRKVMAEASGFPATLVHHITVINIV